MSEDRRADDMAATSGRDEMETGAGARLVTLARLSGMEAELLCARLRGEGVPCFVQDANVTAMHPLAFPNVAVQVRQRDLERAQAIVAEPAVAESDEEYAEEAWRCPKCHRKTVELVPNSVGWKRVIGLFWGVLVVRVVILIGGPQVRSLAGTWWREVSVGSSVLLGILALVLIFRPRAKRCVSCGYVFRGGKSGQEPAR